MIASLMIAALGILLTIAPDLASYSTAEAALLDRVLGPTLAALATLMIWDILAPLRWICALIGLALLVSPLWLPWATQNNASPIAVHLIVGSLVMGLSLLRTPRSAKYAGGWSSLWKHEAPWWKITWS